ncbi:MAG: hypothetical protein JXB15_12750 [Anaerolineales bacterium]|nr:hypothetical protein [Anaerolineales bacterium]
MFSSTGSPYDDHTDRQRLEELRLAHRLLVYPTIWRSLLLLTSRVWDPAHDARQWLVIRRHESAAAFWLHHQTKRLWRN